MRPLYPLVLLALLSGCATSLRQLDELKPAADDFPSALASEYQDYANSEYEQGRIFSAEHFASKGLKALDCIPVQPEDVDSSLTEVQKQQLGEGRTQLVKFLNDDMKQLAPQKLARAQLLFECWQNELIKNINQTTAPCQGEFASTMAELQELSDTARYGKETKHVIVFEPKSTAIDEQGLAMISEVAQSVATLPNYRVILLSYTGKRASQRHITEKRLGNVRRALVKAGVGDKHIRIKKAGGTKAVILSRDNIAADTKKVTILVKTHDKTYGKSGAR